MLLDRVPSKASSTSSEDQPQSEEESHEFVLQLRHYAISARTPKSSLPKALRRLETADKPRHSSSAKSSKSDLPNLGKLDDVADYLLDPTAAAGFTSASESEPDTDAEVEVLAPTSRKVLGKEERQRMRDAQRAKIAAAAAAEQGSAATQDPQQPQRRERPVRTEKKAIKLQELGPRMTLRLTKVEEGLCGGKIMWHEYIKKSGGEVKEQEKAWETRRKEKEERRRVQKENVDRKKKEKKPKSAAKKEGEEGEDDDDDEDMDMWSDDDDEWHGEHDGEGGDGYSGVGTTSTAMDQDEDDEEDEEEEEEDE